MKLYKVLATTGITLATVSVLTEVAKRGKVINKITKSLVDKQPELKDDLLKDYLDKKVISIRVNELNDFRDGEVLNFENVILHNSVVSGCRIESKGLIAVGSNVQMFSNMIVNPTPVEPLNL